MVDSTHFRPVKLGRSFARRATPMKAKRLQRGTAGALATVARRGGCGRLPRMLRPGRRRRGRALPRHRMPSNAGPTAAIPNAMAAGAGASALLSLEKGRRRDWEQGFRWNARRQRRSQPADPRVGRPEGGC